jgi:hypothetical protein
MPLNTATLAFAPDDTADRGVAIAVLKACDRLLSSWRGEDALWPPATPLWREGRINQRRTETPETVDHG